MMRKINEAYEVLSDKQKRFDYDHGKDIENIQLKMHIKPIQNILITEIKKKEEHTQTQITHSYHNEVYYNFNDQSKSDYSKK